MTHYFENFYTGPEQFLTILAAFLVWAGFFCLGGVLGGNSRRLREADVFVGWGLLSLLFVLGGVFSNLTFTTLAIISAVIALGCLVVQLRSRGLMSLRTIGLILILGMPLILLVSGMRVSQWDEFGTWAKIPQHMLELDRFPSRETAYSNSQFNAYPFSWHFISYLVSKIAGSFQESGSPLMNVLLLLSFSMLVLRLVCDELKLSTRGLTPGLPMIAACVLATTLLNPTFAQKVVLTSYSDTSSAILTGVATILCWKLVEALRQQDSETSRALAWQLGISLMLLLNIKQATLVLSVLVVCALISAVLRDPAIRKSDVFRILPAVLFPSLIIYLSWRYHVKTELSAGEFSIRPFSDWFIGLIPEIVTRMLLVLSKKGYFAILLIGVVYFGLVGLKRWSTSRERFAYIATVVILGYEAFLLFAYVAAFGENDALRAASFWRYNMHLGLLIVSVMAVYLAYFWLARIQPWLEARIDIRKITWLPIILLVAAPFAFADKLRFDREPWVVHYRAVGAAINPLVSASDMIFVLDPLGNGESAPITVYENFHLKSFSGYLGSFHRTDEDSIRAALATINFNKLLVHSVTEQVKPVLNLPANGGYSYLMERSDQGNWKLLQKWPHPLPGR